MEESERAGPTISEEREVVGGGRGGAGWSGAEVEAEELRAGGDREGVGEVGMEYSGSGAGDLVRSKGDRSCGRGG